MIEYKEYLLTKEESQEFHRIVDKMIEDGLPVDEELFAEIVEQSKKNIAEKKKLDTVEKKPVLRKPTLVKKVNVLFDEKKITEVKKNELMQFIESKKYDKVVECFEEHEVKKVKKPTIKKTDLVKQVKTLFEENKINEEKRDEINGLIKEKKYEQVQEIFKNLNKEKIVIIDRISVLRKIEFLYLKGVISIEDKAILLLFLEFRKYGRVLNFLSEVDEEMKELLDSANKK